MYREERDLDGSEEGVRYDEEQHEEHNNVISNNYIVNTKKNPV
jgi:hypothetical protein